MRYRRGAIWGSAKPYDCQRADSVGRRPWKQIRIERIAQSPLYKTLCGGLAPLTGSDWFTAAETSCCMKYWCCTPSMLGHHGHLSCAKVWSRLPALCLQQRILTRWKSVSLELIVVLSLRSFALCRCLGAVKRVVSRVLPNAYRCPWHLVIRGVPSKGREGLSRWFEASCSDPPGFDHCYTYGAAPRGGSLRQQISCSELELGLDYFGRQMANALARSGSPPPSAKQKQMGNLYPAPQNPPRTSSSIPHPSHPITSGLLTEASPPIFYPSLSSLPNGPPESPDSVGFPTVLPTLFSTDIVQ